ncbi:hypothetical protein DXG01_004849 [Tephrocybe rancida]|nr:hypothetical protein DXG01_004849 [Tephrocybe rancida]
MLDGLDLPSAQERLHTLKAAIQSFIQPVRLPPSIMALSDLSSPRRPHQPVAHPAVTTTSSALQFARATTLDRETINPNVTLPPTHSFPPSLRPSGTPAQTFQSAIPTPEPSSQYTLRIYLLDDPDCLVRHSRNWAITRDTANELSDLIWLDGWRYVRPS